MESRAVRGKSEELSASGEGPDRPGWHGDDDGGGGAKADGGRADIVRVDAAPMVTRAKQVGVIAALGVFAVGAFVPAVALVWAALSLLVSALAGTALLHTGGLEPHTFGPALLIGLAAAVLLLVLVGLAPGAPRDGEIDIDIDPTSWYARHPVWSRYPALATTIGLMIASLVTTLAGSTHSPFYPYPLTTVTLVTMVAFTAAVSFVAAWRLLGGLRPAYRWACQGSYRAGFVTASCLLIGLVGTWASYAGWTTKPVRMVEQAMELDQVRGPHSLVEAGETVLCLGAGEVEPALARSKAAPACSMLPGATAANGPRGEGAGPSDRDQCFETLMQGPYASTVRVLTAQRYSWADAEDAASRAALATCTREPVPTNPPAYFTRVAQRVASRTATRARRNVGCDDLELYAETECTSADTADVREGKLAWLKTEVMCRLKDHERAVADRYLHGQRYKQIDEELGLPSGRAKNTFNYAMDRLAREIPDILEVCAIE